MLTIFLHPTVSNIQNHVKVHLWDAENTQHLLEPVRRRNLEKASASTETQLAGPSVDTLATCECSVA